MAHADLARVVKGGAMLKKKLVRWFVGWTDSWNQEFHNAIEARVIKAHIDTYKDVEMPFEQRQEAVEKMRTFYYTRMVSTATLLLAVTSVLVALVALSVSLLVVLV
jgi:hypothetical protein